jgi:hypothetical protein
MTKSLTAILPSLFLMSELVSWAVLKDKELLKIYSTIDFCFVLLILPIQNQLDKIHGRRINMKLLPNWDPFI